MDRQKLKKIVPPWVIPLLVLFGVGTVWLRLAIVSTTYEINQTEKMITNARKEQERAKWRVARLRAPEHLERLAKQKFRLGPPRAEQVIHLEK
jgi:cell division protein FtsL